jgi:FKBP-type peptidyl-prolyl cis-trans isomerase SlpA
MRPQSIPSKGARLNRVEPGSFLTLHYRLRGDDGAAFVDTFATQPATLSLGTGELAPAMEARLIGMEAGSEQSFALAAGEAFGQPDPGLVQRVSRALLAREGDADDDYRVGDVVRFPAPDGQSIAGVVRDIEADAVVFDFNHPLAGRPVTFDVKLIGVL